MNGKSIKYALLIGAVVLVGLFLYGAVSSSDDAQDAEKSYELRAAEITAIQFRINQLTRKNFDFYGETSQSQCYIIKMASDDTKENYGRLASLNAPPAFQDKHEALLSYLNNTHLMWLGYYNSCASYSESDKRYHTGESLTYGRKASELLTGALMPWMQEWDAKYPVESAALYRKYHP